MTNNCVHLIKIVNDGPDKYADYKIGILDAFTSFHQLKESTSLSELTELPGGSNVEYQKYQNSERIDTHLKYRDFLTKLMTEPFRSGHLVVLGISASDLKNRPLLFSQNDCNEYKMDISYRDEICTSVTMSSLGRSLGTSLHETCIIRDVSIAELTDFNNHFMGHYEKGCRIVDDILSFDAFTSMKMLSHYDNGIGFVIYEQKCLVHQPNSADKIIVELKKYIVNEKAVAEAAMPYIEKYGREENYVKATEFKVAAALHEITAYRLQRIVDGLPAFEEATPGIVND